MWSLYLKVRWIILGFGQEAVSGSMLPPGVSLFRSL